jgi:PilZ domain
MSARDLVPLIEPTPIRLRAHYRKAGELLRELARALNRGHTSLHGESGLPVGTRLTLVMTTDALAEPIEVAGTVTGCRRRSERHEIGLRYDFEAAAHRTRLSEAMRELRRETRKPRREARLPTALRVDAGGLARALRGSVSSVSRTGCRLELTGSRLPRLEVGSRLVMALSGSQRGTRAAVSLQLQVRWVEERHRRDGESSVEIGGRFVELAPAQRERIRSILRFDEFRPVIRLRRILRPPVAKKRR